MMKKYLLFAFTFFLSVFKLNAQVEDEFNAIKLYVSPEVVAKKNSLMDVDLQDRLYRKLTQLINQTGVAEIGYSTFLVVPVFDILSTSVDQTGIAQVHLAECELNISIQRTDLDSQGGAIFSSFSKSIMGSGSSKKEAISNAINSVSVNSSNTDIINYLKQSKQKIDEYFKTHCKDVIKEARQALELKMYQKSIALFFSIPSSAPCYNEAIAASQKVYATYVEDECNKQIILLKSYVALAQTTNDAEEKKNYGLALDILSNLSPSAIQCYQEAKLIIEKIEKRLNETEKQNWESIKKISTDKTEVQKSMYKAMGKIGQTYQPPATTNVIIAH